MNQAVIIFRAEQDNCAFTLILSPPYAGIFPCKEGFLYYREIRLLPKQPSEGKERKKDEEIFWRGRSWQWDPFPARGRFRSVRKNRQPPIRADCVNTTQPMTMRAAIRKQWKEAPATMSMAMTVTA